MLAESMKQQLQWPLEHCLKEHKQIKAENKTEMVRCLRVKQDECTTVAKLREKYYSRCKETAVLCDTDCLPPNERDLGKHEQRLKRAREAEVEADAEFKSHVYRLTEIHSQWQQRMQACADEFQRVEQNRLDLARNTLISYAQLCGTHASHLAVQFERLAERSSLLDHQQELDSFVRRRATGNVVPSPPQYTSFYGHIESGLRRLSVEPRLQREMYRVESGEVPLLRSPSSASLGEYRLPSPPSSQRAPSVISRVPSMMSDVQASFISHSQISKAGSQSSKIGSQSKSGSQIGSHVKSSRTMSEMSPKSQVSQIKSHVNSHVSHISHVNSQSSHASHVKSHVSNVDSRASNVNSHVNSQASQSMSKSSFKTPLSKYAVSEAPSRSASMLSSKSMPHLFRVRTLYAYQAQEAGELSFKANQLLLVTSMEEDPWWLGYLDGSAGKQSGLFPSNYVERV